jgi:hypothetical protein
MKKISAVFFMLFMLVSLNSFCQGNADVEMADMLRSDGKIYTVVMALGVILTGLILFLLRVDRKVFRLENQMPKKDS